MKFIFDPVTIINLLFCIGIVIISVWWQKKSKSRTPLYIGLAFGLFAISHIAVLLDLKSSLEMFLVVDRIAAYVSVFIGLFFIARESIIRRNAEEELRKNHEELNKAYEELSFREDRLIDTFEELQKAHAETGESRAFLENIINTLDEPIFVKDQNHRLVLLNDAFCHFIRINREILLGKSDYEIFPKEEADVFTGQDNIVLESGLKNFNKEKFTDASGRTHAIVTTRTVFTDTEDNTFIVGVIEDLPENKVLL